MMFEMPQYEVRDLNMSEWEDISEIDIMQKLHEYFDRVTPAIQQMIEGDEVLTQSAVYRLKVKKNVYYISNIQAEKRKRQSY
ncbi:MAG: hypothetical protein GY850_02700 [bacterium]|nr:hypothetical protein [bacterium]